MIPFSSRGTAVVALQQVILAAVLGLLLIAWLHIPDANAFEVLASVLAALLLAVVAGAGECVIALRLTGRPWTTRRLLQGVGFVWLGVLLWFVVSAAVDHLSAMDALRAGYLNSRFPTALRYSFTYARLLLWSGWFWSALLWMAAALLSAAAFAWITAHAPLQGLAAILRSGRYWLALLFLSIAGSVFTGTLMTWTPGHGLAAEMLSLVVRMILVIAVDAVAVAFLMESMARAVLRTEPAEKVTT